MNLQLNIILFFVSALSLFSCGPENGTDQERKKQLTSEIEATIAQYCADVKTGGLTAEFKYLDNSPDFRWTPPGSASPISYDSVVSLLTENASSFRSVDNTYQSLHIQVQDEIHASYSAFVRSVLTSKRGKVTRMYLEENGSLIRRDDGWKLQTGVTKIVRH